MKEYKIRILDLAYKDIGNMTDILSNYYPSTAINKYDAIMDGISKLSLFPEMCEVYHKRPQFRRLCVEDYLVFYQVNNINKTVDIYRILYARRNIEDLIR